jgi:hypothetical protein
VGVVLVGLTRGAQPALAAVPVLTPSKLAMELDAAVTMSTLPRNLDPSLRWAVNAKPLILLNGCSLHHSGVKSRPCVYGDTSSHTSVALFGDSHAAAWFPALELISNQQHWRLVDFTKSGCPSGEVSIKFGRVPYRECTAWRANAQAQIAALHPALVIVSGARWMDFVAHPEGGVPTGYGSTWLDGLAATFSFLRHAAGHVVFISDVPTLTFSAPGCVSRHKSDVDYCDTDRNSAVLLPNVKAAESALASRMGVDWVDPTSWFCAPSSCPVIVGHFLLYRDSAHMTPSWSRYIAPLLADSIVPIMGTMSTAPP